jgi:hypothetical protein
MILDHPERWPIRTHDNIWVWVVCKGFVSPDVWNGVRAGAPTAPCEGGRRVPLNAAGPRAPLARRPIRARSSAGRATSRRRGPIDGPSAPTPQLGAGDRELSPSDSRTPETGRDDLPPTVAAGRSAPFRQHPLTHRRWPPAPRTTDHAARASVPDPRT